LYINMIIVSMIFMCVKGKDVSKGKIFYEN
jgi:hypothetical protein